MKHLFSKRKLLFSIAILSLMISATALFISVKNARDFYGAYFDNYNLKMAKEQSGQSEETPKELSAYKIEATEQLDQGADAPQEQKYLQDSVVQEIAKVDDVNKDVKPKNEIFKQAPTDAALDVKEVKLPTVPGDIVKVDKLKLDSDVKVKISANSKKEKPKDKLAKFSIQIGAFRQEKYSLNVLKKYNKKYKAYTKKKGNLYFVYIGTDSREKALDICRKEKLNPSLIHKVQS